MASFSHRRVADYLVTFLKLTKGGEKVEEKGLSVYLKSIGYCSDTRQSRQAAREFIEKYDFDGQGELCFEDFLLAMEDLEGQVEELRTYLEETLRYFCTRKLEQNLDSPFGIDDLVTFLARLGPEEAKDVIADIEKEVVELFRMDTTATTEATPLVPSAQPQRLERETSKMSLFKTGTSTLNLLQSGKTAAAAASLPPAQGLRKNPVSMNIVNHSMVAVPENTLVEIVVNRLLPKPKEAILYEEYQGHQAQQLIFDSLSVRSLEHCTKPKLRKESQEVEYAAVDPLFVLACGDAITYSKPIRDYRWREETTERLVLDLTLPSLRSEEIADWVDRTEVLISVFDFQDGGVTPWTEWIGSVRKRLSWFLTNARDGAPVACSIELSNISPASKFHLPPTIEFSIVIPEKLIKLWHTCKAKGVHPASQALNEAIKRGLERRAVEDEADERQIDLYSYWKRRSSALRNRFPRRQMRCLGRDEYGTFHLLCSFLQPLPSVGTTDMTQTAATIAAIDSGDFAHCDIAQSSFHFETIMSPSHCLLSKRASSLEASLLLCSAFLGMGFCAFVCFGEAEMPWVVTLHEPCSLPRLNTESTLGEEEKDGGRRSPSESSVSRSRTAPQFFDQKSPTFIRKIKAGFQTRKRNYRRGKEKEACEKDREITRIRFWNPSTGTWHNEQDPQAPKTVDCVFNHTNIWVNVQKSNRVERVTWSTICGPNQDTRQWEPFLTPSVQRSMGEIAPVYSAPDFTSFPSLLARNKVLESKILLSDIVDAISLFRQHKLFLPDTLFDPDLSRILQTELFRMKKQIEYCDNLQEPDDVCFSRTLEADNHVGVPLALAKALRPGTVWTGSIFAFKTVRVQDIMAKLQETGILCHSNPTVRYTVAAAVFPYPWGLSQVWVFVGTLFDIAL